jgi:uncharacterized DUF497 family protein
MPWRYEFRWNDWNVEHIARHGVTPQDAEFVVEHARPPYPEKRDDGRWYVTGQARDGTYLQVSYIFDPKDVVYVIHARPLTDREKRRYRRRRR